MRIRVWSDWVWQVFHDGGWSGALLPHSLSGEMLIVSQTETTTGMIPRAVEQVFRVADELKTKGWQYKMEGQFLEIVGFSLLRLWFSVAYRLHDSTTRRLMTC